MSAPVTLNPLLRYYQQRAAGSVEPPPKAPARDRDIVQAHAEAVKRDESLKKLAGHEPGDGGRKA